MKISPISYTVYSNSNYNYSINRKPVQRPSFTSHPDFDRLRQDYDIKASSYFRRGQLYGSPVKEYIDVVDTLNTIFQNSENKKRNMLIVGIGDSQETFSYLATIKSALKGRSLKKNVDLYTVDLQSRPKHKKLFEDSFYDSWGEPRYSKDSFIRDVETQGLPAHCKYRVKDDIFDLVRESYFNPEKSKWDSRIQDIAKDYPDEKFDIISANNVLPYIMDKDDIVQTIKHLKRALKPGGYFITDRTQFTYMLEPGVLDNLKEVHEGIYQKVG